MAPSSPPAAVSSLAIPSPLQRRKQREAAAKAAEEEKRRRAAEQGYELHGLDGLFDRAAACVLPFPLQCNRINVIVGDAVYAAGEKSAKESRVPRSEVLAHAAAVRNAARASNTRRVDGDRERRGHGASALSGERLRDTERLPVA